MRKFEYHVVTTSVQGTSTPPRIKKWLNEMGEEGWEIVNTKNNHSNFQPKLTVQSTMYTFKRKKPSLIKRFFGHIKTAVQIVREHDEVIKA